MMFFTRVYRFLAIIVHLLHTVFQMLWGTWRISKLKMPIVTIFGSSRIKQDTPYTRKAQELGQRFMDAGVSILTGGGGGIMEAAACGLPSSTNKDHKKGTSMGIGVTGLEENSNKCAQEYFELKYFFARKWLLTEFSIGFVIFPGGFGTLDEMAGVLTLIQTKKLKQVPVVLIGKEYWASFVEWIEKEAIKHGAIKKEELEFFYVTDNLDDAYCWVLGECDIVARH